MNATEPIVPQDQYAALCKGCGLVELADWSSVTLAGSDRQTFLNNFCTNDVKRLQPGENCEAFLTNVKGKIVGHGLITCREDELVLITVPGQAAALIEHLDRYLIREDVQLRDTTADRAYLLVAGGSSARDALAKLSAVAALDQRHGNRRAEFMDQVIRVIAWFELSGRETYLVELDKRLMENAHAQLASVGAVRCGQPAFEAVRIESGLPFYGIDFNVDNLPQEVGRDDQAISFTKGCYLGQETVARIDALGHVNQQLAGVQFDAPEVPSAGTTLTHSGAEVGHVTSATFSPRLGAPLALALVRRSHLTPGNQLESTAGPCHIIQLPLDS
jgi:folate-binding protein YgfZ